MCLQILISEPEHTAVGRTQFPPNKEGGYQGASGPLKADSTSSEALELLHLGNQLRHPRGQTSPEQPSFPL